MPGFLKKRILATLTLPVIPYNLGFLNKAEGKKMFNQEIQLQMRNPLTKNALVEKLATKLEVPKKQALEYVEHLLEIMKDTLENGENLKINGFGSFIVKEKKDRLGRNPQTGESLTITARRVLTFKPSQLLKSAVNTEE